MRVAIAGAGGKMGGRLVHLVKESGDLEVMGGLERPGHPAIGRDLGEVVGLGTLGVPLLADLHALVAKLDLLFEFTAPEGSLDHVRVMAEHHKPMVLGTTGFSKAQLDEVRSLAQRMPLFMAPNMSLGINVMYRLIAEAARLLGADFDVEIVETHHRYKVDAPSGTAVRMAEVLAGALGRDAEKVGVYGRKGIVGQRTEDEIGILSLRAGDITGDHSVLFGGIGERLELVHRSQSRDSFGRGALRAARWIVQQPPGLYDMQDLLGLK
ncbi:MAG: 4-hydroxy-tetrahydrodipicolinate reductase [Nitrospinae bacterium]|nr:4-hydroxy-tetrahydrodipicolinate reductase [Nitrospinota bacterium]